VGLDKLAGEIYCYMTAPRTPESVDQVFAAGADRIAHDLHVWDAKLHALEYIADKFGPNKAFSSFVVGLEPLDSLLEGAEYLANRGIVPAFSVWMPTPGSVTPDCTPPDLEYYQLAQKAFGRLFKTYNLRPSGIPAGSDFSLCHDIYRH